MNPYASTTTVTSSPNPSASGPTVKFVAKVVSSAPGGIETLTGGTAMASTAKLPVGTLTITATYNGDAKSAKSSGTVRQTVK
ncbi:MAG TPA: hypothetical protein VNO32_07775 [Candidatus Acidoferrum sp.]|nr:hypothetical protein [Candidatus Acidoferrum sp.]